MLSQAHEVLLPQVRRFFRVVVLSALAAAQEVVVETGHAEVQMQDVRQNESRCTFITRTGI